MEAAAMKTPATAMKASAAAALGVAEIGRNGKHRQNNGQDDRQFACHSESFPTPSLCYPVGVFFADMRIDLTIVVFSAMTAASLAGLLLLAPIPQDQSYHQFADQRTIFGIPNFWNVVSNLPFLAVGAAGLRRFHQNPATTVFFLGVFLTGIGSSYYHWNPNDGTLFCDRMPMTLSFAAILALIVGERMSARAGAILLWPALAIGLFSLLLWRWTDDLRLYFWAQFFPGLAVLSLLLLYPAKYTRAHYWIVAVALYALAKMFEFTDAEIYSTGTLLSGHTLKHLSAAGACFAILKYFQVRLPIAVNAKETATAPTPSLSIAP
jgi:Ceramidase